MDDLGDMSKKFKQMSIGTEDVNILLMGETGVGKSTFINAFANYMEYDKFQVAEKSAVRCLIPSSFTVTDENMQEKQVKIGQDKNENEEVGESATQGTRSYVFPLPKYGKRVRLIDTPGVGDTRGLDQDFINFENILTYIGNMEYLHAICFLLKPNNSRITVYFEYCIKQLLSRLEKSASRNIIFLFTNSRSTFYRPGDTAPAVRRILDQIRSNPPHADIKFDKNNVFCLDNESFRFMVSYKEGIRFTKEDKESFSRSWEQSVGECWRMIEFITGEGNSTVQLVPHKVQDTISVNNARRIIIQLSQPLADIADLINDNINLLQRHNNTLAKDNLSMADLKKRLYVPVVNLRHKELKQPTTICTNAKCSEIYMVAGKKKYHYKQRCHDPCYLRNVPAEIIGSPELIHCHAMLPSKKCRECSCDFSAHMHIYYVTETYEDKITDTGVQSQITDRETAVSAAQGLIKKIEARTLVYEEEKEVIVKNMAKFAHFLQHNAIAPYNDAYKAYIEYLIDRENSFGQDTDNQLIMYYQDLLKQYDEEKKILDEALRLKVDGSTSAVSSDEIFKAVQALFGLTYTGQKIKELFEKQTNARKAEYEDNTEYVLDAVKPRNINPSIKGINKKPKNKKVNKRNSDDDSDGIPSDMKEKFQDLFQTFPEMEEYFAQKHRSRSQKSEDDVSNEDSGERKKQGAYNRGGKSGNQQNKNQGAFAKGQQNNPDRQQNYNRRGRGQNYNQGRGNNRNQNYDGHNNFNQGQGPHNQKPYNQGQGFHVGNQGAGPNPNNQNQGQGPYRNNQGNRGAYNQGRGNYNRGYNQGTGNYKQGPGGYNQGPGEYNHGPGPHNQNPSLQNQASGPHVHNQGPGPYNQGPGPHNQGPGPYNQGPGPYNQDPGPYNQGRGPYNQCPGRYNQGQQSYNNQGPPIYPHAGDFTQGNPNYEFNNRGPLNNAPNHPPDPNYLYRLGDGQGQPLQVKRNNFDEKNYKRPSGPYEPDVDEKKSGVDLRHMDKFLDDCEIAQGEPEEEVDGDFEDFMKRHGLNAESQGAGGYEKNQTGGSGRGRGGGRYHRGGRGGNRRSKSKDKFADGDGDSDSGHSYSSRGTNRSNRETYKRADKFEFIALDEGGNR